MADTPRLMISAGEASGEHHAARCIEALRARGVLPEVFGMGGPRLDATGMEILVDCRDMAIVGLVEVLRHWRRLSRILERMRWELRARRPDLLILVDYPEFNLKLARTARELGIPVLYYVSPQVWAWRARRIRRIGQTVDMMAVVFPFETDMYERAGVPVRYVGHPLVDEVHPTMSVEQARNEFGLAPGRAVIGLMPGSRNGEIRRLLPLLIESAREVVDRREAVDFLLPLASTLDPAPVHEAIRASGLPIRVVEGGRAYDVIQVCDAMIAASGTATLETALLRVPLAVVYRVHWLTFQILRQLVTIPWISLVNIVAGRTVVREFIQGDARPGSIADEALRLIDDAAYREMVLDGLDEVRQRMGQGGGPGRMAELIIEMLAATARQGSQEPTPGR